MVTQVQCIGMLHGNLSKSFGKFCVAISLLTTLFVCLFVDTCGFKSSTQKKDPDLQMVLCNLHLQRLRVQNTLPDGMYLANAVHSIDVLLF